MNYPVSSNEDDRIKCLESLKILDTAPEAEFEAIVELASDIFDCPLVGISFINGRREWFKARKGIDHMEVRRSGALTEHALLADDVLVVTDTHKSKDHKGGHFVSEQLGVQFYAGCALTHGEDHPVGVISIADRKARRFAAGDRKRLKSLAAMVEGLLKAHASAQEARQVSRRAEKQKRKADFRALMLRQIEEMAEIGAWSIDINTGKVIWSDEVFKIHDLPAGKPPKLDTALEYFPSAWRQEVMEKIGSTGSPSPMVKLETDLVTSQGNRKKVRYMGQADRSDGAVTRLFGVVQDISEFHDNQQKLWNSAHIDELSGMANRRWFHERLEKTLADMPAASGGLALFLFDLDGFKDINDSNGHHAGDEVIHVAARRISDTFGPEAFCGRIGGDEFAVFMLTKEPSNRLEERAHEVIEELKKPIHYEGTDLYVSSSVGIARAPDNARTAEQLLKCADIALYKIKRSGRGRAGVFSSETSRIFDARRDAMELVRDASLYGWFEAHYQPIRRTPEGYVIGAEALVRIRPPNGHILGPEKFWPAFADAESARRVDSSVFKIVLENIQEWIAMTVIPGTISINASQFWFQTDNFSEKFMAELNAMDVAADMVRLEIQENALLGDDKSDIRASLSTLSRAGVSVALDDFGAGFGSLTHVTDYPIDTIKIDRSFVHGAGSKRQSTVIVKAITDLAKSFNLTAIAAGVETSAEAQYLQAIDCNLLQGSAFDEPMPPSELIRLLPLSARVHRLDFAS